MADLGAVRRRRQRDAISAARETARDGAAVAGEEVEGERDAARCAALRPRNLLANADLLHPISRLRIL